jgi:AcrR family transcriptional regulator
MYREIPPTVRNEVVRLYKAGVRLADITEQTGLARPSIYWVLRSEGQQPNRQDRGDTVGVKELLEALRQVEQENGRLKSELEALRRQRAPQQQTE